MVKGIKMKRLNKHPKTTMSFDDKIYFGGVNIVLFIIFILVLYPVVYIVSSSFSSATAVMTGKVVLWPVDFSLEGYKAVMRYDKVFIGFRNTVFYTVVGTSFNIMLTMIGAYPLARKGLPGKGILMFIFSFTMIFTGGMIPTYMLVRSLGIMNTPLAMILPGALSVYNLIIARTFIQNSIPNELLEAAQLDGCNDFKYFFKIVLPLSKAIIAVLVLFYAVGHWNQYFKAFLYLRDPDIQPLQIVLRDILIANTTDPSMLGGSDADAEALEGLSNLLRYSLIVISSAPIICVYPFIQKYFDKGIMIGSLKG